MSRKEKKRAEEKGEIARRCLKGEISVSAAGQEAGVDAQHKGIRRGEGSGDVQQQALPVLAHHLQNRGIAVVETERYWLVR